MVKVRWSSRGLRFHNGESNYGWDWIGTLPVKLWLCIMLLEFPREEMEWRGTWGNWRGGIFLSWKNQILGLGWLKPGMAWIGVGSCLICLTTATANVKIAMAKQCSHTKSCLWPHCLTIEMLVPIVIIRQGLPVQCAELNLTCYKFFNKFHVFCFILSWRAWLLLHSIAKNEVKSNKTFPTVPCSRYSKNDIALSLNGEGKFCETGKYLHIQMLS